MFPLLRRADAIKTDYELQRHTEGSIAVGTGILQSLLGASILGRTNHLHGLCDLLNASNRLQAG
jgi:hypothetical protein